MDAKNEFKLRATDCIIIGISALIPVIIAVLLICFFWKNGDVFFNSTLCGLIFLVFITYYLLALLFFKTFRQSSEYEQINYGNEIKRKHEEFQSILNFYYRFESMKLDKSLPTAKEIPEKDENIVTLSYNQAKIDEIKKVMEEIKKAKEKLDKIL